MEENIEEEKISVEEEGDRIGEMKDMEEIEKRI